MGDVGDNDVPASGAGVAEMGRSEVGQPCRLETLAQNVNVSHSTVTHDHDTHLDARNAHFDVRRLDRAHVIRTVPDREQDRALVHPNVDRRLLVPRQHPNLDPSFLQRVDRVQDPFLGFILDHRRSQ